MDPINTEIVVVGAGPGGYAAAFYAADLGKKVILVERDPRLGGVCLNRGCIPSKALLHAAHTISAARESEHRGITFGAPTIDVSKLRAWKESILTRLSGGIAQLAKMRGVQVLQGRGYFEDSRTLRVETEQGQQFIQYDKAIVAVGSKSALPKAFDLGNPRVMTSREALEVEDIPENLLVIGGGYIGMELGHRLCRPRQQGRAGRGPGHHPGRARTRTWRGRSWRYAKKAFKEIRLKTKVGKMATSGKQIKVEFELDGQKKEELYDRVLVAVGRSPNADDLGLENTKVSFDDKGFIHVNEKQQTTDPAIYAIGDIAGGVLLAHKAAKEARVAVEVIVGEDSAFTDITIPAVVFTDPELAWCGLTESEAKAKGIEIASGQVSLGRFRARVVVRPAGRV